MSNIIRLLPDSVANQIAAGEVIQRPASAVKELLENAVDSGATEINLILKDAGKTLIQVTDNGCGMSDQDARMAFERHATSKIEKADDLFAIKTLGFRGEALASIAAIAQLQLKSKLHNEELGTCINIEGSKVKSQQSCSCPAGTSILVKNLFYNVPARRNFLKSNPAELKHIIDEFFRVALIYNDIRFSMYHNEKLLHQIFPSNLKQRIVALYGNPYNKRLVPVESITEEMKITGFVGKPEYARKTRGEQFFFVNGRFIKHPYLHHAVENAFQELLPSDYYPTYFIYFDVNPKSIDVNIHPTKTEIQFQDSKYCYAILRSAIKQALGKHSLTPTLDFDMEQSLDFTPPAANHPVKNPFDKPASDYNPFDTVTPPPSPPKDFNREINIKNWEKLYEITKESGSDGEAPRLSHTPDWSGETGNGEEKLFQLNNRFIVTNIKSGIVIVDQQKAHERILYEQFLEKLKQEIKASQQELFPQQVTFSSSDSELVQELIQDLNILGFTLNKLSKNTFVVNGTPEGWGNEDVQSALEQILDNYKKNLIDLNLDKKTNLARSMAVNLSLQQGKKLHLMEMRNLIDQLFACNVAEITPDGDKTFTIIKLADLEELFK